MNVIPGHRHTKHLIITAGLVTMTFFANAQVDRNSFDKVDAYISRLGAMEGHGPKDIIDSFNTQRFDALSLVRGIYGWIGRNIGFDCKSWHHPRRANNTATATMQNRMATGEGYANLFQAMCDLARIECITIHGFSKWNYLGIGKTDKAYRHAWNAVKIYDIWFVVDPTWAAGYTDVKVKTFTKSFTDAWFFSNRKLFALSHFPDNKKWQLLEEPVNKSVFAAAPVVLEGAIVFDVYPLKNQRGSIKGREGECKALCFEAPHPSLIKDVKVSQDDEMVPAEFHVYGSRLYIEVPFADDGTYPIAIRVNNARAFSFIATATKKH